MTPAGHARRRATLAMAFLATLAAFLWACSAPGLSPRQSPASALSSSPQSVLGITSSATGPLVTGWPGLGSPLPAVTAAAATPSPTGSVVASAGAAVATPSPTGSVVAPPAPRRAVTVSIVAAGDIACDPAHDVGAPTDCDQAATADLIGQLHPTAVLTLGDNQYEDATLAGFNAVFGPTWGKYRSIMYPAIGNHEYLTSKAAGYFSYFSVPAYYSFNLGNWHMIELDSECSHIGGCGAGSGQERWLEGDLAAHPSVCTLVYWHEPRWSSGEHKNATQMSTIWADLAAAHVDVVLSGHNHDYERFVPLDATGRPDPAGVTEFVVGTGGKNHYGFVTAPLTGEVVRNDASFGVIQMTLRSTSYSWKFVAAPGYGFTDSGSANCVP